MPPVSRQVSVSPNYSSLCKIIYLHSVSCEWRVFVRSRQEMALLAISDWRGLAILPARTDNPGTMTRSFPYGRDIYWRVATARPSPPVCLPRPGDFRAQKSRRVAINVRQQGYKTLSRHRGILAHKSPVSDGIKNKLKSRTHLPSLSLKLAANVRRADPEGHQVWFRHIFEARSQSHVGCSAQNDREELFRIYGETREFGQLQSVRQQQRCTERAED